MRSIFFIFSQYGPTFDPMKNIQRHAPCSSFSFRFLALLLTALFPQAATRASNLFTPGPGLQASGSRALSVKGFQFGGPGGEGEQIIDMAVRPDNRLVAVGTLNSAEGMPGALSRFHLVDREPGSTYAFVAEFSPDGRSCTWFSLFGGDLIEPTSVALAPDGSIAIGGKVLDRGIEVLGPEAGSFQGRKAIIVKVSADGSRMEWAREGGPNQEEVSDIAVDDRGRVVHIAGCRVRGGAAYIMRLNPDGSPSEFPGQPSGREWGIDFDVRGGLFLENGQIGTFYEKGKSGEGYDYDGSGGWGPVRFKLMGIRQNGQVVIMPNGDIVACGTLQYDFKEKGKKWFPAFDTILARFREDGSLVWSTNLYQPGDSVHTPDQKDADLILNPANVDLYILVGQHGSNVYRFKGELVGDTGNLFIYWVGRVDAGNGDLKAGWYWQNSRNTGYTKQGIPKSPPYPKLAGNTAKQLAADAKGNIYMVGSAGAKAFTTSGAWQDWPKEHDGGSNGALTVLSPDLDQVLYATMIRGSEHNRSFVNTLVLNSHGVWLGGMNRSDSFPLEATPWSSKALAGEEDALLIEFRF